MRDRLNYLTEQIALILLGFALLTLLYPHVRSIWLNSFNQPNFWAAVAIEIQVAWPVFLVALVLIVVMLMIILRHKELDNTEEIHIMLYAICNHLRISKDELNEAREKVSKKKAYKKNK